MNMPTDVLLDQYVEQSGTGSPVVFIHGSFATPATWKRWFTLLSEHYHCIAIRLPGHDGAPDYHDYHQPDIETEVLLIERVVERLTDQPVHLIGHSFGGVVALSTALSQRVPIARLSLFEPVAVWLLEQLQTQDGIQTALDSVERFLTSYRQDAEMNPMACRQLIEFWGGDGVFEPLPEHVKNGMATMTPQNLRHWDVCTTSTFTVQDVQRLAMPVDLVHGSESSPVAHHINQQLQRLIPVATLSEIQGATHFLVTSHVDACLEKTGLLETVTG